MTRIEHGVRPAGAPNDSRDREADADSSVVGFMRFFRLAFLAAATAAAISIQAQTPAPAPSPMRASPVTLSQIVARQKENFDRIKTARGQAVWIEQKAAGYPTAASPAANESRTIFFALEPERNVTLALPANEVGAYVRDQGRIDWTKSLSAMAVEGDVVYTISQPVAAKAPEVRAALYNPAVHEANPLAAFHPRLLAEERVQLSELAASAPHMKAQPQITEVAHQGKAAVRVDFLNPAVPRESLYYILDPAKAYLPLEIGRLAGGQLATRTQIVIGNTKDGTWIPARRERLTFTAAGQTAARENWHYTYLSVNEGLSRKGATLAFFQLPDGTKYFGPDGKPMKYEAFPYLPAVP